MRRWRHCGGRPLRVTLLTGLGMTEWRRQLTESRSSCMIVMCRPTGSQESPCRRGKSYLHFYGLSKLKSGDYRSANKPSPPSLEARVSPRHPRHHLLLSRKLTTTIITRGVYPRRKTEGRTFGHRSEDAFERHELYEIFLGLVHFWFFFWQGGCEKGAKFTGQVPSSFEIYIRESVVTM